jgi:GTP-binding protein LepA
MVFCGLYPIDGDDFSNLREALEKLRLNDASVSYEPETSGALGFGFRCGFLGLLHMEIVRERLEREFDLSLIATAPSVEYRAHLTDGSTVEVHNPSEMPEPQKLEWIEEPYLQATILTPAEYTGHPHGPVPEPPGRDGSGWSTSRRSAWSWSTGSRWPRW